ncbi:hypothetical protein FB45DRAFT_910339 [Roridomyces roridus]|uniref:Zn(2)-C6 fungal-type domain-containing protein n=1 Tax=Roridomyces roridus TaxID=1738132 RepID=A0AAD7BZP1_9AGAR|nr:hypothetical protein FB45DRAFT_910339 [Roridomyces roridus]
MSREDESTSRRSSIFTEGLIHLPPLNRLPAQSADADAPLKGLHPDPSLLSLPPLRSFAPPGAYNYPSYLATPLPSVQKSNILSLPPSLLLSSSRIAVAKTKGTGLEFRNSSGAQGRTKKQALSCLHCRQRKIACVRREGQADGEACSQCARRNRECVYPAMSYRGHRSTRGAKGDDSPTTEMLPVQDGEQVLEDATPTPLSMDGPPL